MSKLYLVDGMSHIYRAYYAIRGLSNREGMATNAVYGFTNMLRKLIQEEAPEYLGMAIDVAGPTVRHEQYEDYKATRRPMPEDLSEQIPYIFQICEAFRIPILSCEKHEADDVIGTLSRQAVDRGLEVVIVTIDKDMFQLVNDHVSVLDTRTMTLFDASEVKRKLGVRPDQVVDVLSLVGDSSDNIPGAPGIGAKGAQKLIGQYGTLENLLQHRDEVKRKTYRESLQQNEEQIREGRELMVIYDDLPVDLDLEALRTCEPDREKVWELFAYLDFTTLLEEFLPPQDLSEVTYTAVSSAQELESVIQEVEGKQAAFSLFFPGGNYLHASPSGLGVSLEPQRAWRISEDLLQQETSIFRLLFTNPSGIVLHDLKPFLIFCRNQGWKDSFQAADTMLMSYLLTPNYNNFSLEQMAAEYLGYRFAEAEDTGTLFEAQDDPRMSERADVTFRLFQKLKPQMRSKELDRLLSEIEIPLVEVLAEMERIGVKVDTGQLKEMSAEVEKEIERLQACIFGTADCEFNLNSPRQLSEVLFEKLHLPGAKKTGKAGHYSTGVEVLEELAESYEIVRWILDYREVAKLKNTYLDALPRLVDEKTGRIHTSYNQMVASTGRLSSSNPNLQNIPIRSEFGRKIRKAFIPEKDFKILAADYSQIELRVMAHLSQDPVLMDAFLSGEDIHERTAREVFSSWEGLDAHEMRRRAKVINFGIMYGLSAFGLARSLKIGRAEAQEFIDQYFEKYQGVQNWIENTLEEATRESCVKTLFGRIRQVPEIHSRNWNLREFAKRTAINAPIQGTAADLIKKAMVSIHHRLGGGNFKSKLILQVHDELVFEAAEEEIDLLQELVRQEMEGVVELTVPLQVDMGLGDSWYEAK